MICRIQNLNKIGWILAELGPVKLELSLGMREEKEKKEETGIT